MTVLERLSTLTRSLDTSPENFRHINVACRFFINSLPNFAAEDFYIEEEITDTGIDCGLKYSSVTRDGIPCRKIPLKNKRRISDPDSSFYVDKLDPVFYKENSKIFVKPDPNNNEQAYIYKVPSEFIPSDAADSIASIPHTPDEAESLILIYAGFLIVSTKARSISFPSFPTFDDVPNSYTFNFPDIPDLSLDLNIDFTSFDSFVYNDISDNDFNLGSAEIQSGLDALQNAFKFIGTLTDDGSGGYNASSVPTGGFWLDDEDPEMVQSATQLAAQEVNRANAYFGNRSTGLNSFRTVVDANVAQYNAKIQKAIQRISLEIQEYQSKLQGFRAELEAHGMSIQQAQTELQKFQIDVQQRLQANQQKLERFSQQVQSYQVEYSTLTQEAMSLFERYRIEFQNYMSTYENQ